MIKFHCAHLGDPAVNMRGRRLGLMRPGVVVDAVGGGRVRDSGRRLGGTRIGKRAHGVGLARLPSMLDGPLAEALRRDTLFLERGSVPRSHPWYAKRIFIHGMRLYVAPKFRVFIDILIFIAQCISGDFTYKYNRDKFIGLAGG